MEKMCSKRLNHRVFCIEGDRWSKYQTVTGNSHHVFILAKWAVCVSLKGSLMFQLCFYKNGCISSVSSRAGRQGAHAHVGTHTYTRAHIKTYHAHTCARVHASTQPAGGDSTGLQGIRRNRSHHSWVNIWVRGDPEMVFFTSHISKETRVRTGKVIWLGLGCIVIWKPGGEPGPQGLMDFTFQFVK